MSRYTLFVLSRSTSAGVSLLNLNSITVGFLDLVKLGYAATVYGYCGERGRKDLALHLHNNRTTSCWSSILLNIQDGHKKKAPYRESQNIDLR